MNRKLLLTLGIVAVVAVAAAVWVSGQRKAVSEAAAGGVLVPDLKSRINDVSRVSIDDGSERVDLVRQDERWVVEQRGGFAADLGQLRRRLLAMADARLQESKTANPERYSQLGVSDVAADDDDEFNRQVTLEGLDDPVSIIVGKRASAGGGTYVRPADQAQSLLVSGDLDFSASADDWIRKTVLDIPATRVRRVTLTHQDGTEVVIEKSSADEANFRLVNLPEGREMLSPSSGNSIASALGSLRIDDVMAADKADFQGVEIVQGVYETFDGLRIDTRAWEKGDKRFVILSVRHVPEAAEVAETEEATVDASAPQDGGVVEPAEAGDEAAGAELAAADSQAETPDAVADDEEPVDTRAEAEELAAVVEGWAFEIPSYKYGNLSKSLEDLLKPLEDDE